MTLLLLVLFVACLAGSIAYSLETAHGVVRGFVVGVIVWMGLAVLALLIRLLFTFA